MRVVLERSVGVACHGVVFLEEEPVAATTTLTRTGAGAGCVQPWLRTPATPAFGHTS